MLVCSHCEYQRQLTNNALGSFDRRSRSFSRSSGSSRRIFAVPYNGVLFASPNMVDSSEPDVRGRARRRIARRLLPFIFLLYLISMIDRFNVSFAALRMKADLGFSDKVYGFGASAFFITYALLEIPGAIVAERWSVRKWITRIMVSWGLITTLTAFIHSASEFYVARVLLGAAEASFFPAIIVYLTRWFILRERARAIAAFYSASSVSAFVGSAVAAWLLPVHWMGIPGWRWLFFVEGIPAVVVGAVTLFYLTDWPSEGAWLSEAERPPSLERSRPSAMPTLNTSAWDSGMPAKTRACY